MQGYDDDEWVDSDFEPDPESTEQPVEYKPSYVLIAIDTDKSMFINGKANEIMPFATALNSCYEIVNSLALSNNSLKGPVGIMLADNNTTKCQLVEFEQTVPESIKLLKGLKEQSKDELQVKYERKQNFDLADFFLVCKNKLLNIKTEVYKRIIIYITNDDDPIKNDAQKRFKVINESQKFSSIQMELVVVTFNPYFDYSNLYSELLDASHSAPIETVSPITLTQKLQSLVQKKRMTRKCNFYPFRGNNNSYFEVAIFSAISSSKSLKNMYVTRDTGKEIRKTVRQSTADTYDCYYSKQEPPVVISEMEKQNLGETNLPVGYTLAYVAEPILKPGWVIKPPYLMEKKSKESSELFEMFWQFCRDQNKCLVCYQKLKRSSDVRFVELIPKLIDGNRRFLVRIVPYGSEIHYHVVKPAVSMDFTDEEEDAMESFVDSLSFDLDLDRFRDPVESKRQAYIKSQLLEEDIEKIDAGVEADEIVDAKISKSIIKLNCVNLLSGTVSKKRPQSTSYSRAKKTK